MAKDQSIPYCPSCDHEIEEAEVNITEGVALCNECGQLSQLSELNFLKLPAEETLNSPPKSANITANRERINIHLSLFSIPQLAGSLFATLFWNGIVCLFLTLAVAAVCYNTIGYVPDWIPVPGLEEGKPVMNDKVMGVGMTVFFCLFLTPFVIIGTFLFCNTALRLGGSTVIIIDKNRSTVSTGISFIRLMKTFDPYKVKRIDLTLNKFNQNQESYVIEMEIEGHKAVKFGRSLSQSQQEWLITVLRQILVHKRSSKLNKEIPTLYWLK
jgi:hypothetical protein